MNGYTMTDAEIQDKVDWLCQQYEKNKGLLAESGANKGELAEEMLARVGEVLKEYKRLAADYIQFKRQMRGKVDFLSKYLSEWSQEEVIRT